MILLLLLLVTVFFLLLLCINELFPGQLISSVVTQNWCDIVQSCELENWKEALAALLTYANPEEFAPLCGENSTSLIQSTAVDKHGSASVQNIRALSAARPIRVWSDWQLCVCVCVCGVCVCVCRYSGRSSAGWRHREALSAGLSVLHLLGEHRASGGVLDVTERLFFSAGSGGHTHSFTLILSDSVMHWRLCSRASAGSGGEGDDPAQVDRASA